MKQPTSFTKLSKGHNSRASFERRLPYLVLSSFLHYVTWCMFILILQVIFQVYQENSLLWMLSSQKSLFTKQAYTFPHDHVLRNLPGKSKQNFVLESLLKFLMNFVVLKHKLFKGILTPYYMCTYYIIIYEWNQNKHTP